MSRVALYIVLVYNICMKFLKVGALVAIATGLIISSLPFVGILLDSHPLFSLFYSLYSLGIIKYLIIGGLGAFFFSQLIEVNERAATTSTETPDMYVEDGGPKHSTLKAWGIVLIIISTIVAFSPLLLNDLGVLLVIWTIPIGLLTFSLGVLLLLAAKEKISW